MSAKQGGWQTQSIALWAEAKDEERSLGFARDPAGRELAVLEMTEKTVTRKYSHPKIQSEAISRQQRSKREGGSFASIFLSELRVPCVRVRSPHAALKPRLYNYISDLARGL